MRGSLPKTREHYQTDDPLLPHPTLIGGEDDAATEQSASTHLAPKEKLKRTVTSGAGSAPRAARHDSHQSLDQPQTEKSSPLLTCSIFTQKIDSFTARSLCRKVRHEIQLGREIGRGKFGKVYDATIIFFNGMTFPCVAKANTSDTLSAEDDDEIELHRTLTETLTTSTETGLLNWVCTHSLTDEQGKTQRYDVMGKCDLILNSIMDGIAALKTTNEPLWKSFIYSLLVSFQKSLLSLQKRNSNHGDLKPANIGLRSRKNPDSAHETPCWVLLDFGTLTTNPVQAKKFKGTPCYMAPEVCAGEGDMSISRDIYAIGQILAELDDQSTNTEQTVEAISFAKGNQYTAAKCADKKAINTEEEIQSTTNFNDLLQALIQAMFDPLPENRPSLKTLSRAIEKMHLMLPQNHAELVSSFLGNQKERQENRELNQAATLPAEENNETQPPPTSISVSF